MFKQYTKSFLHSFVILSFLGVYQVNGQSQRSNYPAKDKNEKSAKELLPAVKLGAPYTGTTISLEERIKTKSLDYVITSEHISRTSGIHHIYLRQAINGIEVYGTDSSIHIDAIGKTVTSHDKFVNNIQSGLKNATASLSAAEAISSVARQMGYKLSNLQALEKNGGINQSMVFNKANISASDIPVRLMYYYREGFGTTLVWELSVEELDSSDWWNFRVDANTGTIIDKDNWTVSCFDDLPNHEVKSSGFEEKVPIYTVANAPSVLMGSYNVLALPVESPNHGGRSNLSNPDNPIASPYGWHDTNGSPGAESNYTIGNNADAYDDSSGSNSGTDAKRANGGSGLNFEFPFNTNVTVGDKSIKAAVTNLFYMTNVMHDVFYLYGFDEASGNFQQNNYGNGGIGNDSVRSEAQDGSGTCNANFSTPTDGGRGRMQMYVCGTRDGDFDNGVISHEYGHGISTRLTGGAGNSSCLNNQEQMGEGWSDFFGLVLTIEPGDLGTDPRGMGTWLIGEAANGPGIRTQRYDTDTNTYTYNSIKTEVAPHGVGSVWAMMLWEMTWDLIDVYGWDPDIYNGTGGNNIALKLVVEGLKLQPCSPGFVDGRNAILLADQNIYGGANQCTIWKAFARRGLGYSASQGSTNSKTDGTQAFDLPPGTAVFNNSIESLCITEGVQTGLGGGTPTGGVYSGAGVTDDGNGSTYTFDPNVAGIGTSSITYTVNDTCSGGVANLNDTIEITSGIPELICKNATVSLDGTGSASIVWQDVVSNIIPGGYTLAAAGGNSVATFTGAATTVSLGDDNGTAALNIGFNFDFYGNTYSQFYIASNGFISFSGTGMTGTVSRTPTTLPTAGIPNNMIAVVWDDLNPPAGGTIKYEVFGTAPNRKLVVEYLNIRYYGSTKTVSAQAHLYEGTNNIEIHLIDVQTDGGVRTLGIENSTGTVAMTHPQTNLANWSSDPFTISFLSQPDSFADNCGNSVSLSLSDSGFTCKNIGENIITVTADDGNGGISTCDAVVTVIGETTTYNGSWNNGVPDAGKKAIFNSNYNTTTADIDACSCEISNNATVTVAAGDYIKIEGNIIVNSGSSLFIDHEGSLVQVDDNATVTNNGNITVRKETPFLAPRFFMVMGSPMSAESRYGVYGSSILVRNHITANFVPNPDVEAQDPDAENFADDDGDDWQDYAGTVNAGEGYLVLPQPDLASSGSYTLDYTLGTLNNGQVDYNVTYNGTQNASPNVVGNPYASAIDANLFMDENSMVNAVYFWEHITTASHGYPGYKYNNYDMGDISMFNGSGGLPAANDPGTSTTPNGYISSGQGFGFKATAAGTASFKNYMRVTDNNDTYRRPGAPRDRMWLKVTNETYGLNSTMLISFSEDATDGYDAAYDAKRLATPVSLYSVLVTGEELAIQGRSAFNENQEVPLGFVSQVEENQEFKISISELDGIVWPDVKVYLLDRTVNVIHNLTDADYIFKSKEGAQEDRFVLLFKRTLDIPTNELETINIFPNPTTGKVTIVSPKTIISSVEVYDIRGRRLMAVDTNSTQYVLDLSSLQTATYFVKINTVEGTLTKRVVKH